MANTKAKHVTGQTCHRFLKLLGKLQQLVAHNCHNDGHGGSTGHPRACAEENDARATVQSWQHWAVMPYCTADWNTQSLRQADQRLLSVTRQPLSLSQSTAGGQHHPPLVNGGRRGDAVRGLFRHGKLRWGGGDFTTLGNPQAPKWDSNPGLQNR